MEIDECLRESSVFPQILGKDLENTTTGGDNLQLDECKSNSDTRGFRNYENSEEHLRDSRLDSDIQRL